LDGRLAFFAEAKRMVDEEPGTLAWFAFRIGPSAFRIFDVFDTEEDRETHLQGKVRQAIVARGGELFRTPPTITPVDVAAVKLP
jgi:hypothetical protein